MCRSEGRSIIKLWQGFCILRGCPHAFPSPSPHPPSPCIPPGKSEKDIKNLRQEIDILRGLRHENIIQMLDAFETKTDFCVVTGEEGPCRCHAWCGGTVPREHRPDAGRLRDQDRLLRGDRCMEGGMGWEACMGAHGDGRVVHGGALGAGGGGAAPPPPPRMFRVYTELRTPGGLGPPLIYQDNVYQLLRA